MVRPVGSLLVELKSHITVPCSTPCFELQNALSTEHTLALNPGVARGRVHEFHKVRASRRVGFHTLCNEKVAGKSESFFWDIRIKDWRHLSV